MKKAILATKVGMTLAFMFTFITGCTAAEESDFSNKSRNDSDLQCRRCFSTGYCIRSRSMFSDTDQNC